MQPLLLRPTHLNRPCCDAKLPGIQHCARLGAAEAAEDDDVFVVVFAGHFRTYQKCLSEMELLRLQQSNWITTIRVPSTEAQKRKPEAFSSSFSPERHSCANTDDVFLHQAVAPQPVQADTGCLHRYPEPTHQLRLRRKVVAQDFVERHQKLRRELVRLPL